MNDIITIYIDSNNEINIKSDAILTKDDLLRIIENIIKLDTID